MTSHDCDVIALLKVTARSANTFWNRELVNTLYSCWSLPVFRYLIIRNTGIPHPVSVRGTLSVRRSARPWHTGTRMGIPRILPAVHYAYSGISGHCRAKSICMRLKSISTRICICLCFHRIAYSIKRIWLRPFWFPSRVRYERSTWVPALNRISVHSSTRVVYRSTLNMHGIQVYTYSGTLSCLGRISGTLSWVIAFTCDLPAFTFDLPIILFFGCCTSTPNMCTI